MGLELTGEQGRALAEAAAAEGRVRSWRRYRAIQLLAGGERPGAVAAALGCGRSSVYAWAAAWRSGGVEGLREGEHPGRPRSLDGPAEAALEELFGSDPQAKGCHATGWTVPMLRAELAEGGYAAGERTIRRALKRLRWSWKRPKYVLGRPDPEAGQKRGPS